MKEPTRWLDDPKAPEEVVTLLRGATPPPPLPDEVRRRSAERVAALSSTRRASLGWARLLAAAAMVAAAAGIGLVVLGRTDTLREEIRPTGPEEESSPGQLWDGSVYMPDAGRTPLTDEDIRDTVNANRRSLQRCYEQLLERVDRPPSVSAELVLAVDPSGVVTSASALVDGDFEGFGPCLEATVAQWRFPATSEGGTVEFPIRFEGAMGE
jgi:hypothetical protein